MMTEERDWKPNDARLAQWPQDLWDHCYFTWLQGPKPLPALPKIDDVKPRHMFLYELLVIIHGFDDRRLIDFKNGKFDDLDEAEAYDYACETRMSESEKAAEYRKLVQEMLVAGYAPFDVSEEVIDSWIERLNSVTPYNGPRA